MGLLTYRPTIITGIIVTCISISRGQLHGYLGCYEDKRTDRAMVLRRSSIYELSQDLCRQWCLKETLYTYMGTEYGRECYCGDYYAKYGHLPESRCNATCSGSPSQKCGGEDAVAVQTVCPKGYYGTDCSERCRCSDFAVCVRKNGACIWGDCALGWQGESCTEDIDECITKSHECETNIDVGYCINTVGSYKCACRADFTLKADGKCEVTSTISLKFDNLPTIIGVCVGGALAVALLCCCSYIACCRRREPRGRGNEGRGNQMPQERTYNQVPQERTYNQVPQERTYNRYNNIDLVQDKPNQDRRVVPAGRNETRALNKPEPENCGFVAVREETTVVFLAFSEA